MLDIATGDLLVVDSVAYPVVSVERWNMPPSAGILALMTVTDASTQRAPAIAGNKRGAVETNLEDLQCTPLLVLQGELQPRVPGMSAATRYECFIADLDADATVRVMVEDVNPT
jgi:hypothetical protein